MRRLRVHADGLRLQSDDAISISFRILSDGYELLGCWSFCSGMDNILLADFIWGSVSLTPSVYHAMKSVKMSSNISSRDLPCRILFSFTIRYCRSTVVCHDASFFLFAVVSSSTP